MIFLVHPMVKHWDGQKNPLTMYIISFQCWISGFCLQRLESLVSLTEERKREQSSQIHSVLQFSIHMYLYIKLNLFLCGTHNVWLSSSHLVLICIWYFTLFTKTLAVKLQQHMVRNDADHMVFTEVSHSEMLLHVWENHSWMLWSLTPVMFPPFNSWSIRRNLTRSWKERDRSMTWKRVRFTRLWRMLIHWPVRWVL